VVRDSGQPMTKRWLLISVTGALALAVAGCSTSMALPHPHVTMTVPVGVQVRSISREPMPAGRTTAVARQHAVADAIRMLHDIVLPPGSRAVASFRNRALDNPGVIEACNPLEDAARLWLVPGSAGHLAAFLLAHMPAGMTSGGIGHVSQAGGFQTDNIQEIRPGNSQAELEFNFARIGSDTGLRADALVVPSGSGCSSAG
jgi:hypothetical protein